MLSADVQHITTNKHTTAKTKVSNHTISYVLTCGANGNAKEVYMRPVTYMHYKVGYDIKLLTRLLASKVYANAWSVQRVERVLNKVSKTRTCPAHKG